MTCLFHQIFGYNFPPEKPFNVHVFIFIYFADKPGFEAGLISGILVFMSAVCVRLEQHKEEGPQTLSLSQTYRKPRCQLDSNLALCSDDDLVRSIIHTL